MQKPAAWNFIKKETPTQNFSCEFCEIFKNTFFTEHLWMATSGQLQGIWNTPFYETLLNNCLCAPQVSIYRFSEIFSSVIVWNDSKEKKVYYTLKHTTHTSIFAYSLFVNVKFDEKYPLFCFIEINILYLQLESITNDSHSKNQLLLNINICTSKLRHKVSKIC